MQFPVFKAIGATFAFIGAHIGDILKIVWLPVALMSGVMFLIMPGYVKASSEMSKFGPETPPEQINAAMMAFLPQVALFALVLMAFNLIIVAGLQKLVVRGERPGLPFYFALGMEEVRLFLAWLVQIAVYIGIGMLAGVGLFFSRLISQSGPGPAGFIINLAVIAGVCFAAIYLSLRLSLASPATIATRKVGVGASWRAAEDNLGALFGFWFLWGVMMVVVQMIAGFFTVPPGYNAAMADAITLGDAAQREAAIQRANEIMLSMYNFSDIANTLRFVTTQVVSNVAFVVIAVAGGVAWRYLNGDAGAETQEAVTA